MNERQSIVIVRVSALVPRAYHGVVTIDHRIYIIGGFDGMEYFNSCRVFDPQLFQWNEIAPMNVKR